MNDLILVRNRGGRPKGAFSIDKRRTVDTLGQWQIARVLCCGSRSCAVCAGTNQRVEKVGRRGL